MDFALEYLFLFCVCGSAGWLIEVIYRGFRHRKVVNPGFLTGCCLPLYGVGGAVLYFLSGLKLRAMPNELARVAAILVAAMLVMTLIELFGGFIAVYIFRVRLWDYSGEWMHFHGLICPKFSLLWGLICAAYYFLIYPTFHAVAPTVVEVPWLTLFVGVYLGIFLVDLFHSLRILQRIRSYAVRMRTLVSMDQLKINANEHFKKEYGKRHTPFSFSRMVGRYLLDTQAYREQIHRKWGGGK